MSFTDIYFLFLFLPIFLIVYYICPAKFRYYVMLAGGLVFYYIGVSSRPLLMLVPILEILFTYVTVCVMAAFPDLKKPIVIADSVVLFGVLLAFKYLGLFTGLSIVIPAGLSFYTFQLTAYVYDTARGTVPCETNLARFAGGMLFFPKLLSGPITPWQSLSPQLTCTGFSWKNLDGGLRIFITGLGLKVLLADRVGGMWTTAGNLGIADISPAFAWLAALSYSLQLYFDFYGYSLMAIGLGRMLGIRLPDNFDHPYESRSMTEFWRRWHITLGAWFRDYIYIPLGGNRVSNNRTLFNLLVVWIVTGVWHGATLNFIIWALFLFVIIALERLLKINRNRNPLSYLYMIPATLVSWSIFANTTVSKMWTFLGRLFPFFSRNSTLMKGDWWIYGRKYLVLMAVGVILSMPAPARIFKRIRRSLIGTVILFAVFVLSVYCICGGLNDPFMYFNF